LVNVGVGKVIDSTHPKFVAGDLVWGMSGWEEYTLVTHPEHLNKINHPELPLSYYAGVLGERLTAVRCLLDRSYRSPACACAQFHFHVA
jgi:NADPH-dependent curcumin reductase CurA